jgi:hypothetical protein
MHIGIEPGALHFVRETESPGFGGRFPILYPLERFLSADALPISTYV